jgi:hypothetical protein
MQTYFGAGNRSPAEQLWQGYTYNIPIGTPFFSFIINSFFESFLALYRRDN